jgi:hypothetical protein
VDVNLDFQNDVQSRIFGPKKRESETGAQMAIRTIEKNCIMSNSLRFIFRLILLELLKQ